MARVDDVNKQVGFGDFFQRGAERSHQLCGQPRDEPDGVHEQHGALVGKHDLADRRVERGEEFVFDEHAGIGEGVEQCGLAGVGVPDKRHHGELRLAPGLALQRAVPADPGDLPAQVGDAPADAAAINFQFRLAGAPGPDAAAKSGQPDASSRQPRQQVGHLSQLDLQPALFRMRAAGKDVQHQGRPINDFHFQQPFQVALLGRGELAVENHQVGTMLVDVLLEIFDLAGADEGPGIGFGPLLQNSPSNDRPGSFSKSREFLQV